MFYMQSPRRMAAAVLAGSIILQSASAAPALAARPASYLSAGNFSVEALSAVPAFFRRLIRIQPLGGKLWLAVKTDWQKPGPWSRWSHPAERRRRLHRLAGPSGGLVGPVFAVEDNNGHGQNGKELTNGTTATNGRLSTPSVPLSPKELRNIVREAKSARVRLNHRLLGWGTILRVGKRIVHINFPGHGDRQFSIGDDPASQEFIAGTVERRSSNQSEVLQIIGQRPDTPQKTKGRTPRREAAGNRRPSPPGRDASIDARLMQFLDGYRGGIPLTREMIADAVGVSLWALSDRDFIARAKAINEKRWESDPWPDLRLLLLAVDTEALLRQALIDWDHETVSVNELTRRTGIERETIVKYNLPTLLSDENKRRDRWPQERSRPRLRSYYRDNPVGLLDEFLRAWEGPLSKADVIAGTEMSSTTLWELDYRNRVRHENIRRQLEEPGRSLIPLLAEGGRYVVYDEDNPADWIFQDVKRHLDRFFDDHPGAHTLKGIVAATIIPKRALQKYYKQIAAEKDLENRNAGLQGIALRGRQGRRNDWTIEKAIDVFDVFIAAFEGELSFAQMVERTGIPRRLLGQIDYVERIRQNNIFRQREQPGRPLVAVKRAGGKAVILDGLIVLVGAGALGWSAIHAAAPSNGPDIVYAGAVSAVRGIPALTAFFLGLAQRNRARISRPEFWTAA
ncbi:MAG TPA: hypothetical protein VMU17_07675 [Elusimicrobiota bacterium]|nr:hypothetical protein [Elusimicrobiota bacterium]